MNTKIQPFDPRQILKSDRFEIFHYKEEKTTAVGTHHHDFYELYLLLAGQVSYIIEGKTYRLETGDFIMINPQEMHHPVVTSGNMCERIVLWINCNYLDTLCKNGLNLKECFEDKVNNHIHPDINTGNKISELLEKLNQEYHNNNFGKELYTTGLFYQILVEINRLAKHKETQRKEEKPDLPSRVVAFINQYYDSVITLDRLAKEFFISKYHLSHEFTKQYGISIYKYITLKRLMMAKEKISNGVPLGEVYKSCGFGDYTTFFRAFKAEYGISPKAFKENQ